MGGAPSSSKLHPAGIPGSVSVADGRFTLTGCGHAMTGFWERRRGQGVYVSQTVTGDAAISARLTSLAPNVGGPAYQWDSRPSTASGLMLRESLTEAVAVTRSSRSKPLASSSSAGATRSDQRKAA